MTNQQSQSETALKVPSPEQKAAAHVLITQALEMVQIDVLPERVLELARSEQEAQRIYCTLRPAFRSTINIVAVSAATVVVAMSVSTIFRTIDPYAQSACSALLGPYQPQADPETFYCQCYKKYLENRQEAPESNYRFSRLCTVPSTGGRPLVAPLTPTPSTSVGPRE